MHEIGTIGALAKNIVRWSKENDVTKVMEIELTCGRLRLFDLAFMQRYFSRFTRGTVASEAVLKLEFVPLAFRCQDCGEEFEMEPEDYMPAKYAGELACSCCKSDKLDMISGDEYYVSNIVAEVADEESEE